MFFATRLTIPKARVEHKFKKAKDRWENVELKWREFPNPLTPPSTEQERQVFFEDFFSLLNCYQGHLSRPAQVNFTLWFNYLWST